MDTPFSYLNQKFIFPNRSLNDSWKVANNTIESLTKLINSKHWSNAQELISLVEKNAPRFLNVCAQETTIMNVILRTLKLVREEALKILNGPQADFEQNLTDRLFDMGTIKYNEVKRDSLLDGILGAVDEFRSDMKTSSQSIASLSNHLVHSDELIMTVGYSSVVLKFLHEAKSNGNIKVMVTECEPTYNGHKMAQELAKDGIYTVLIPDSHVFALMSRVNKLIVSCDTVYPDGTMRACTGTHCAMLAAKRFAIPTYVCLAPYKLSPVSQHSASKTTGWTLQDTSVDAHHPEPCILPVSSTCNNPDLVRAWAPKYESIPPGLIGLFLTYSGAHPPSYMYAVFREFFHPTDVANVLDWIQ